MPVGFGVMLLILAIWVVGWDLLSVFLAFRLRKRYPAHFAKAGRPGFGGREPPFWVLTFVSRKARCGLDASTSALLWVAILMSAVSIAGLVGGLLRIFSQL